MDPSAIPLNVCKLQENNETKIEETFKVIHQKLLQVQRESMTLRAEVTKLNHETALLEKEEYCLDSKNKILEEEILSLKVQTENVAVAVELLRSKMYNINVVKEFEQKQNEYTYKVICVKKETLDQTSIEPVETKKNENIEKETKMSVTKTRAKIDKLKEEIENQKRSIQMTDPKLLTNMKMLEKRNAALLLRYQRQLGEATSRYRQTLTEVNSLKRILAEKNALLADTSDSTFKK